MTKDLADELDRVQADYLAALQSGDDAAIDNARASSREFIDARIPQIISALRGEECRLPALTGEAEPVAWRYRFVVDRDGGLSDWFVVEDAASIPTHQQQTVQPLYTRPQPVAWPEGFKLVPVEPTEAMFAAGMDPIFDYLNDATDTLKSEDTLAAVWTAMLSASDGAGQVEEPNP